MSTEKTLYERIGRGLVKSAAILLAAVPFSLLNGLVLMVAVGAVHRWLPAVPTVGYWSAVVIAYGLMVLSPLRAPSDGKD